MKKATLLTAMLFGMLFSQAQFSRATLQATGLTCAMCSNAINKALQKLEFVESVRSDIKNSSFSIVFKSNTDLNIDAIRDAVEDAGFSVGSLKLTGQFTAVNLERDRHVKIGKENFLFLNGEGQSLNGEKEITVVDRNFLSEKQFKKISASSKMSCVQTGKAAVCCEKDGIPAGERVYHVTI